jgi:hypothetical protein
MDDRIARVETNVEHLQRDVDALKTDVRAIRADINTIRTTDFRLIFAAIITVALGLAGLMAKGFQWV